MHMHAHDTPMACIFTPMKLAPGVTKGRACGRPPLCSQPCIVHHASLPHARILARLTRILLAHVSMPMIRICTPMPFIYMARTFTCTHICDYDTPKIRAKHAKSVCMWKATLILEKGTVHVKGTVIFMDILMPSDFGLLQSNRGILGLYHVCQTGLNEVSLFRCSIPLKIITDQIWLNGMDYMHLFLKYKIQRVLLSIRYFFCIIGQ